MGLCHSNTIDIDRYSYVESDDLKKVLLLGTDYSGKSTLFKQIEYKCSDGFIKEADIFENEHTRDVIYYQVIEQMRNIITHLQLLDDDTISTDLRNAIKTVSTGNEYQHPVFIELAGSIQYIWKNDKRISDVFTLKGQLLKEYYKWNKYFILHPTTEYFWNNIDRIKDSDYKPSYADIVRVRRGTSNAYQRRFQIDGVKWQLFDTDGRKGQRKWRGFFDSLHAIIYTVNLNSFDQMLMYYDNEDGKFFQSQFLENRMVDSIETFDKLMNQEWLVNSHIILVFTMIDLFEEKIKQTPITKCPLFTDYPQFVLKIYKSIVFIICDDFSKTHQSIIIPKEIKHLIVLFGGFGLNIENNIGAAKYYIKHEFEARNKNKNKTIHTHFINALDSQQVKEFVNKVNKIMKSIQIIKTLSAIDPKL